MPTLSQLSDTELKSQIDKARIAFNNDEGNSVVDAEGNVLASFIIFNDLLGENAKRIKSK